MPTQDNSAANAAIVTLTTTTETAIVSSPPVSYNMPGGEGNLVQGNIVAAIGAGATSYQWKVYQGVGIGGTLVKASGNINVTASTTVDIGFEALDSSALALNGTTAYTVSLTVNGATANSTVGAGLGVISITPSTGAS